jgi:hypothetical protein
MTTREMQDIIVEATGLKVSVRKGTGSLKGYYKFWPQFQNDCYPDFPIDIARKFQEQYPGQEPKPNFFTRSDFCVYGLEPSEVKRFKREIKPKGIEDMKVRTWGSKYSQLRLDQRTRRNVKRLKDGNGPRYY